MRGGALAVRRANPCIQSGDATLAGGERYLVRRTQLRVDSRLLPSVVLQTGRHKDVEKLHSALLPAKVLPATGPYVMSNDEQEYDRIALLQVINKARISFPTLILPVLPWEALTLQPPRVCSFWTSSA